MSRQDSSESDAVLNLEERARNAPAPTPAADPAALGLAGFALTTFGAQLCQRRAAAGNR